MRDWSGSSAPRLLGFPSLVPKKEAELPTGYFYFGLIGLSSDLNMIPYGTREFGFFERVLDPPSASAIHRAVLDQSVANALIRYAPHVTFQLAISAENGLESACTMALHIVNALRVKTRADLLVPAELSVSWARLANAAPGSCEGKILEDIPFAATLEEPRDVQQADFDWLWESGEVFEDLLRDARFNLAVESLCYCHLLRDERMMVAGLWAGIEALCGVKQELRFRIALIASAILEPRGERRKSLFKRLQELYDVRSKAVHGEDVPPKLLMDHVLEVRILLSKLIMHAVSLGRTYTKDDVDAFLLL